MIKLMLVRASLWLCYIVPLNTFGKYVLVWRKPLIANRASLKVIADRRLDVLHSVSYSYDLPLPTFIKFYRYEVETLAIIIEGRPNHSLKLLLALI